MNIDHGRSALLVMDLQNEVVAMLGDKAPPLLERVAGVIAAARAAKLPIIYVAVGFRPGYPEISPANTTFMQVAKSGRFDNVSFANIAPAVKPVDGDILVVKHRVSAFYSTDLEMILRAKGIDTMILCGLSTSGVVLSTVRYATDADYKLVIVKDGCADPDEEVHRVLTEKVFARHAIVATAAELTTALAPA
jgi:nicotinamidase-related amidase